MARKKNIYFNQHKPSQTSFLYTAVSFFKTFSPLFVCMLKILSILKKKKKSNFFFKSKNSKIVNIQKGTKSCNSTQPKILMATTFSLLLLSFFLMLWKPEESIHDTFFDGQKLNY